MQIFCVGFLDFMLNNKTLADLTCLFLLNNFKEINKIINIYFLNPQKWKTTLKLKNYIENLLI